MSQESHHHHHYPFNEISAIAGNLSSTNNFDPTAGGGGGNHDPFTNWAASSTWPGESSSMMAPLHTNQVQSLSLSLFNPPSFQITSHHPLQLRNCKYLLPAQELLNEFCSLGVGNSIKKKNNSNSVLQDESSSLYNMEPLELQRRKAKLFTMLEEVDRRYRRYSEQMKAVVSTFEETAGDGAAKSYSMLAWKAMSRHFRCLRDGISGHIKATRKAMGEKDDHGMMMMIISRTSGLTKGETPRLRLLDQCFRQQKQAAIFQHHSGIMDSPHPWRPQRGLPERSVSLLRAWLFEHFLHPYPSDVDKHILARQTGLSRSQVSNWFINARVRLWKPMVEEMYLEELEEEKKICQSPRATSMHEGGDNNNKLNSNPNPNPSSSSHPHFDQDQKSSMLGHLNHIDEPHSLSSIINSMHAHHHQNPNPNHNFDVLDGDHYGSYHGQELTLGLQHHEGDAMQFSILVGEGQSIIPYRNLMGAQLLRDLAD